MRRIPKEDQSDGVISKKKLLVSEVSRGSLAKI